MWKSYSRTKRTYRILEETPVLGINYFRKKREDDCQWNGVWKV